MWIKINHLRINLDHVIYYRAANIENDHYRLSNCKYAVKIFYSSGKEGSIECETQELALAVVEAIDQFSSPKNLIYDSHPKEDDLPSD
jgi:hypothetical protein